MVPGKGVVLMVVNLSAFMDATGMWCTLALSCLMVSTSALMQCVLSVLSLHVDLESFSRLYVAGRPVSSQQVVSHDTHRLLILLVWQEG